ncbi:autotransporter outer membrane beta-barrel domain-containing protein [Phascolarctobacterium faecium]|jgi:outer membrane autotransporter protein|uniref:autotransporter outer membrane beta-barrel domain-containing protein n=1 Tax=Phascolarctobacterium faecium TaxID=33025 RepID=UPI00283FF484|nr:autotransporter outer membrane beta-barrel domain-containing protein [Phascolarctobacterium sp.]
MSKKEKLQKALAVSLMLTNIFCSPVWADPVDGAQGTDGAAITKNEDISGGVSDAYTAAAGTAGSGGSGGGKGGDGGNGGSVTVNDTVTGTIGGAIEITATGGDGAAGGAGNTSGGSWDADDGPHGNNGAGGDSQVVINVVGSGLATVNDISVTAQAGSCSVYTLTKNSSFVGNVGSNGGKATAIGLQVDNKSNLATITAADITISAVGGQGGRGGSSYNNGGVGGIGGAAEAYGLSAAVSLLTLEVNDIQVSAVGGEGGQGGSGGESGNIGDGNTAGAGGTAVAWGIEAVNSTISGTLNSISAAAIGGDGGDGGNGGNATAYAAYADNSKIQLTVDTVTATATAGAGGTAGAGATKIGYDGSSTLVHGTPGTDGTAGTAGMAKAYGIYATGSTVELKHSTPGSTITIGATATGTDSEAYAVYATDSNVVLQDKINITSGTTFLHNSTVAFTDRTADRTFTSSGELKLAGSNEFRVTTDLANNSADKFTFAKLVDNSSTDVQYITVGYDKSFDGSNLGSITGDVAVLTVTDLNGQNLDNFVGRKTTMDNPLERFTAMPTVETSGNDVKITGIEFGKTFDPSETAMTLSDAQMALGSMWRIEGNNLMKRMGELRSDKEAAQGGVWARYYRGELNTDSAYDRNFSQDYTAFQGGIDKVQDYKGGKLYTGIAVNRIDSNAGYTAGSGDLSSTGVGVYASWLGSKGHYIDVIARGSKLTNDFKLVDLSGNAAKADYDTWAYGISAEYGYRQNLNAGWFVEPQAELSLGHLGSADYTTSNEVSVKQDSVNSAVVRLGFLGGKEFTIGGHPSNAYVKASALHDFGGNGGATGYYGNDSLALQTGDLTGTWYEIGLGANLGIAKNSNLYFDALKTFGGNLRTDWQFNAGLRFTF